MPERSPIIFWLLLAVTICVDVVAGLLHYHNRSTETQDLFLGLAFGQISVLCIWITFSAQGTWSRVLSLSLGVLLAVVVTALVEPRRRILFFAAVYAIHVLFVSLALWTLGAKWRRSAVTNAAQFSMKSLLVLMTVVAIATMMFGAATSPQDNRATIVLMVLNNAIVAAGCVAACRTSWHPMLAFATALAVALVFAWLVSFSLPGFLFDAVVINCLQTIVIFLWLQWGGTITKPRGTAEELPQPAAVPAPTRL